jgi:predicted secreted protein
MQTISITQNTTFTITEPQNPSTGYTLSITTSPSIKVINDTTLNQSIRIGASQFRRWVLVARELGIFYIVLLNAREWENNDPYTKIIKVNVHQ